MFEEYLKNIRSNFALIGKLTFFNKRKCLSCLQNFWKNNLSFAKLFEGCKNFCCSENFWGPTFKQKCQFSQISLLKNCKSQVYFRNIFCSENGKWCVRSGSSTVKMATHCLHTCMTFSRVSQSIFQIAKFGIFFITKNCNTTLTGDDEVAIFMSLGSLFKWVVT